MAQARTAIVTGGTRGFGQAVALRLASEGHRVICVHRETDERALAAARAPNLELVRADLLDPAAVEALLACEPDYLINAAGEDELPISSVVEATLAVCQRAAVPMARKRFGRIVNFSSPAATLGGKGQAASAAAMAGIRGLTGALARELAPHGVTVNAVSPGPVSGELLEQTPLRRCVTSEEVAGAVRMLLDDQAGYITGQCLAIDGGLT